MGRYRRRLLTTYSEQMQLFKKAGAAKGNIAFDIETENDMIISVAVVFLDEDPDVAWCCVEKDGASKEAALAEIAVALVSNPDVTLWGHHVQYDIGFVLKHYDSVCRCKAVDSLMEDFFREEKVERGQRSLKYLAEQAREEKFDADVTNFKDMTPQEIARYNCQDALIVKPVVDYARDARAFRGELSEGPTKLYSRIIPFITEIEARGFQVSLPNVQAAIRRCEAAKAEAEERIFSAVGGEFNLNSPQQKSWAFFGQHSGLPLEEWHTEPTLGLKPPYMKNLRGKTGIASTRLDVLERLADTCPEAKCVGEWVLADKTLANLNKIPKYTERGICYPSYNMARIVSGRIAVTDPPLQTYSAKKMPDLKRCFGSRFTHGWVYKLDGSQMELRWGAMESGCEYLCDAFREGKDFHQETADLFGGERSMGKTVNFASIYGCSQAKLVSLGLTPAQAKNVTESLQKRWHELYEYEDRIKRSIVRTGKTFTNYGFYRHVPGVSNVHDPLVRSALNFRFQAPASHLTQLLGSAILEHLTDADRRYIVPVMTEHDGLSFDVHPSYEPKYEIAVANAVVRLPEIAKEYMNTELTIPFTFENTRGPNWLDQYFVSEQTTAAE